ncbi:MAG TPA: DUF4349 domain-containing protein [Pyrinomonadaceae bacterium]|jgi:hypothetical protein
MKSRAILSFVLSLLLVGFTSCSFAEQRVVPANRADTSTAKYATESVQPQATAASTGDLKPVSLTDTEKFEAITAAVDRKIIRNADLTMEVPSTIETQHRIVSIAETHGGFVVTSEAKQRDNIEPSKRTLDIKLVVRVPENQFGATLDQVRALGNGTPNEEKVTGQDVTEEFIDLEARLKTQKALEAQFLLIMRQAGKISDALEVQRQIADVRTEIEKLEGRKRFLENRSSLATITVNLQTPTPIVVTATGFKSSVRDAVSDSVEMASAIVLFFVRFAIGMIPIIVLVLLPGALLLRYLIRRAKRLRLAAALSVPASQ